MTSTTKTAQIEALRSSAQKKAAAAYTATEKALRRMIKTGQPITIAGVAREAEVSRRYLSDHPEFGPRIRQLRDQEAQTRASSGPPDRPPASSAEASVIAALRLKVRDTERRRAQETKQLRSRIKELEEQLAIAHGQIITQRSNPPP